MLVSKGKASAIYGPVIPRTASEFKQTTRTHRESSHARDLKPNHTYTAHGPKN